MLKRLLFYMAGNGFSFAPTYTMLAFINNRILYGRTRWYVGYDHGLCIYRFMLAERV